MPGKMPGGQEIENRLEDSGEILHILERANHIASTTELDELLDQMLDLIIDVCGAEGGILYLLDDTTNTLSFEVVKGENMRPNLTGNSSTTGTGLAGATVWSQQPILVKSGYSDARWEAEVQNLSTNKVENALSIPLQLQRQAIGVVQVFNFSRPAMQLVQLLGNRMASEIEKAQLIEGSKTYNDRLEALVAIIGQIGSTLDRSQILRMIVDYASELLNSEIASIFLVDEETGNLVLLMSNNLDDLGEDPIVVPPGKGIIGHVVETGETVIVPDTSRDKRHYKQADQQSGVHTQAILAVPLCTQSVVLGRERGRVQMRTIGGLEAINKRSGNFTENDAKLLRTLATQAGTVLEIAELYADANELFLDVLKALTAAVDAKDPYTVGHSLRVSEFSVAIAQEMGLSGEMIHRIRVGALLHDVGKIGIPDTILAKPERLNDEEYDLVKDHPIIGERIMEQVRMLDVEIPALAEHHERLDGTGYPKGLKGDQISLTGRIVAVADVFDALTSDRPYRKAMQVEDVIIHMREVSGAHLDGACVEALVRAYRKDLIHTEQELGMRAAPEVGEWKQEWSTGETLAYKRSKE